MFNLVHVLWSKLRMLENALEKFSEEVFHFITKEIKKGKTLLVKKHTENLNKVGDFSFPNTIKSWHVFLNLEHISDNTGNDMMKCIGKTLENLVEESKKWSLQIQDVTEQKGRVHMFLMRSKAIHIGLLEATKNNVLILHELQKYISSVVYDPLCDDVKEVTSLRVRYLSKSIQNLYTLSVECNQKAPKVFVTAKSSSKCDRSQIILSGAVLNGRTGAKETHISGDDFIR